LTGWVKLVWLFHPPHNRGFARLVKTALFEVEQHLHFSLFHTL